MARYLCEVCGYVYDEEKAGEKWEELSKDWVCPVCESPKTGYRMADAPPSSKAPDLSEKNDAPEMSGLRRDSDELEVWMADIRQMAETGRSVSEPMRTRKPTISWDDILIKGAQLANIPLDSLDAVNTRTVIGPKARKPLVVEMPIYITHMSFGALSREAKIALAKGSARAGTATCSGEGGILPEARESAHRYIFEYVPNQYSVSEENLKKADAVEIKIGQSAKPGMGGHLPGNKVTKEIAAIRGFREGEDIRSPSHFRDIGTKDDLRRKVDWLREVSGGRPVGIKLAAGHIAADLEVALHAGPDFVTIDGRAGATGSAPKFVKAAASVPTIFALHRARRFLDEKRANHVSLIITGGLRISPDFAKALAMGADAVALGTSALIAIGCQQYRVCDTGRCPMGITTHDPLLRKRLDVDHAAKKLENFLRVSNEELKDFARLTGNDDVHKLGMADLCTTNSEISGHTAIEHA